MAYSQVSATQNYAKIIDNKKIDVLNLCKIIAQKDDAVSLVDEFSK